MIEPYQHSQVVFDDHTEVGGRCFLIREKRPGGDWVRLRVDHCGVRFTAGPLGVAPVYVAAGGGAVHASWDVADLAPYAARAGVNPRAVVRLLTRRHRYSSETLFTGITRVTERGTVTSDGHRVVARYPDDAPHVIEARTLRHDADPVAAFDAALGNVVAPVVDAHGEAVAVELSGGVDSANVALSAVQARAAGSAGPLSAGLVVAAAMGREQQVRRAELVTALGLRDHPVLTSECLPFGVPARRVAPHDGDGEFYAEAFDALRGRVRAAGAEVILSGFGGDEMMALRVAERPSPPEPAPVPPWLTSTARELLESVEAGVAPVAPVAVPCLMAVAARNPAYLRCGLWPVAPLATPKILRLGESLPVAWRADKRLLRQRLAAAGLSTAVTHPARPESFGPTMRAALYHHGPRLLAEMRRQSVLADLGYIDPDALSTQARLLRARRPFSRLLCDTLALELGLTSMIDAHDDPLQTL